MSRKNKLKKFNEILNFRNVVENYDPVNPKLTLGPNQDVSFKGSWAQDFFNNDNPLTLELACGRGEYSLQLGAAYPNRNFLAVDIKGARIWLGARNAIKENLNNVKFFRTRIEQLGLFFAEQEISEVWITFPDPFYKKENKRLTSHRFLDSYKQFIAAENIIHLKTDDDMLYEYTIEVLNSRSDVQIKYQNNNIYKDELVIPELDYKTYYERQHLQANKTIKYVSFHLDISK
jgi:tRNA (guanine-N7-)-methyltransferase